MNSNREKGMALVTALLVLLLVSSIIVGLSWMVMTNQRLGGNNANRQSAFYAAEAGMEKMTADLGSIYATTNALSTANINTVMGEPPVIQGVNYAETPTSYFISYPQNTANGNNPLATNHTILTGAYAGLQGLLTPFTLTVQADMPDGSEARLVRLVQTVGIPVFQFGMFSQVDMSFFPGPVFNFGGRVHTNGNLWLASGNTVTLANQVTVVGNVVLQNLANGYATIWTGATNSSVQTPQTDTCSTSWTSTLPSNPSGNPYPGAVMVAVVPGSSCQQLEIGSVTGSVNITTVATAPVNSNWNNLATGSAAGDFNGSIRGGLNAQGQPMVQPLSLNIATPAIGGSPIALVTRPVTGENSQLTAERYYSLSSINILLDDSSALLLGTPNSCGTPIELSTLAYDTRGGPNTAFPSWYTGGAEGKLPLPSSGATSATTTYTQTDGYWIKQYYPIIQGYILINMHNAAGACVDVTQEILNLGFIGRNLNPLSSTATSSILTNYVNTLSGMASDSAPTPLGASTCADPSLNAVIRLARLRDNPSNVYTGKTLGGCGTAIPYGTSGYLASDYWPNVLYDTREGVIRDEAPPNPDASATIPFPNGAVTASGVMNYVELDVNNLTRWFTGAIGKSGTTAENNTGYAVYFSDRRGEHVDPTVNYKTGAFGYNDNVNPSDTANGCPNGVLDTGEDYAQTGALVKYANTPNPLNNDAGTYIGINNTSGAGFPSGTFNVGTTAKPVDVTSAVFVANTADATCTALSTNWPGAEYFQSVDARENPPLFFRHALKLVNGSTISIGTCNSVPCGLTVASENPVYVFGNYNCMPSSCGTGTYVSSGNAPASVVGDSVTLLSSQWNDVNSFAYPYTPGGRPGNTTTYRMAVAAGKGVEFVQISGTAQDYGTDGGVHNYLRYLEAWSGTLYYDGSLVSFFYNEQAIGVFKCCTTVYSPPTRGYTFDTEFLTPALLPPRTPMLRDVNNIGFTQDVSPLQ